MERFSVGVDELSLEWKKLFWRLRNSKKTLLWRSFFLIGLHPNIRSFFKQNFSRTFSGKFPKLIFSLTWFYENPQKAYVGWKKPRWELFKSILLNKGFSVRHSFNLYSNLTITYDSFIVKNGAAVIVVTMN